MYRPVRCLARGAAVQRDLASRALLWPLAAFVIGTRLARRVVAFSGFLLSCLNNFFYASKAYLGGERERLATKDETDKTRSK